MKFSKPSDLELQALSVLWENKPLTVREVMERLPDGKKRAYTTVLTILQVMEKKGLAARQRAGQSDRWEAAVTRQRIMGSFFRHVVGNLFGGSASAALQQLLSTQSVDAQELKAMKDFLREYEAKQRKDRRGD